MSGNKKDKDTKTNVSNTTKKNEEEESAELVRLTNDCHFFKLKLFTAPQNEGYI
jgi:hypothetical protein